MSIDQKTPDPNDRAQPQPPTAEPHLFRFGLRQLLLFVAGFCLLLAAMAATGGATALLLLLATAVVVFHVLGTALATHLRSHTDRTAESCPLNRLQINPTPSLAEIRRPTNIPCSPWHARASTPLPWLARLVITMSLFGGVLGAVLLTLTMDRHTTPAGVAVGSVSFAIVAGWLTFLGYSFCGVFRHGLKQAMADDRHDSAS